MNEKYVAIDLKENRPQPEWNYIREPMRWECHPDGQFINVPITINKINITTYETTNGVDLNPLVRAFVKVLSV